MTDPKDEKSISAGGDITGRDKVTVGNVTNSAVAIGEGARATVIIQAAETPAIWVGVPAMPPRFVGRDELLQELVGQLTESSSQAIAVQGLPGVGKSTLAVALAHHVTVVEHFKDGVLWAGLGPEAKEEDIAGILNRWASALGLDISTIIDLRERKQAVEDAIGQKALLIVVDDAWDYDLARHLRFGNLYVRYLLTTRDQDIAGQFAGVGGTTVAVPTLKDDPAFQLLQTLAPEAYAADPQAVQTLAHSVGGLPLALELLGGYLAVPRHKLRPKLSKKALTELMDPVHRLQLAQERLGAPGRKETLQEAITLSIESLLELQDGEALQRAFYALGAFAPKPQQFRWEAAEAVTGTEVEELVIRNLVEMAGDQLAMHQVMADVAKTQMDETAVTHHRDYYLGLVNEDRQDWQRIEEIYGQVRRVWESIPEDEGLIEMIWALRVYHNRRGLWQEALAWSRHGLDLSRKNQWPDIEGNLLNNIGMYFDSLGQPEKALEYYYQALPILEEADKQVGLTITLTNIGMAYDGLGQWEKALEYSSQALHIQEEMGDWDGQATSLNNIGTIYFTQGQYEKALEFYNQAIPFQEAMDNRYHLATTINNIGMAHARLGDREKALVFYNRALPIREEVGDRNGKAVTLFNMAVIFHDQGRLQEEVLALKQVVELDRLLQSPDLENDEALLAQVEMRLAAKKDEG